MSEVKNIPDGWVETTLGENLTEIAMGPFGSNLTVDMFTAHGVPIIKGGNLSSYFVDGDFSFVSEEKANSLRKAVAYPNDLIITHRGTIGQVSLVPENKFSRYVTSQSQLRLCANKKKLHFRYLLYFFKSKLGQYEILKNTSQVGVPAISTPTKSVKEIELTIPKNIEEQKSIAAILTVFDDKIELLKAQNNTLEEIAQTIFKEWFGKYKIEDELPEGYRFGTLGEIAYNHSKTFKFSNNKVVFVNTGDVSEGQFLHSNEISPEGLPGQAKKAIELHDILYSEIRPKNKRFAFVDFNSSNYVVSTKFMIIRPKNDFSPFILYLILKNQDTIDEFNIVAESRSGTFPQITFDAVKNFPIIIPNKEKQNEFDSLLLSIMEKKKTNHQQIQTLTKTRDELLPRLMTGEIRVNEFKV